MGGAGTIVGVDWQRSSFVIVVSGDPLPQIQTTPISVLVFIMAIPASRPAQLSSKINEAIEAGEKFVEIFYDTVDKRRQVCIGVYSIWSTPG